MDVASLNKDLVGALISLTNKNNRYTSLKTSGKSPRDCSMDEVAAWKA